MQQQPIQEPKLREVEVAGGSGLIAFLAHDSNTNIRFLDHIDVVAAIAYAQHSLTESALEVLNDQAFLGWGAPTEYQRPTPSNYIDERELHLRILNFKHRFYHLAFYEQTAVLTALYLPSDIDYFPKVVLLILS